MKIKLITIGKTDQQELRQLQNIYTQRLGHYINFNEINIPDLKNTKNLNEQQQKSKEGELIIKELQPGEKHV